MVTDILFIKRPTSPAVRLGDASHLGAAAPAGSSYETITRQILEAEGEKLQGGELLILVRVDSTNPTDVVTWVLKAEAPTSVVLLEESQF